MLTFNTRIRKKKKAGLKIEKNPRKRPMQTRSADTVNAILEATARILEQKGYAQASTNLIAHHAGVSIGSLYQYFPNKDVLVVALMERMIAQEWALIEESTRMTEGAATEMVVRGIIATTYDFFRKNRELRKVLFEQIPEHIKGDRPHVLKKKLSRLILRQVVQSKGKIRRQSSSLEVYLIVSAIEAALSTAVYRFERKINREDFLDNITDLVLRYLTKPRSSLYTWPVQGRALFKN